MLVPAFGLIACGGSGVATVPAGGTVTYNGQPLASGQVQFMPDASPAAPPAGTATTEPPPVPVGSIENGTFTVSTLVDGDGAPPGKYRVSVFSYSDVTLRDGSTKKKSNIPERYSNHETSALVVVIPAGGNREIKLDLTK
ncbi:MAG TPA: hypothetical protein VF590_01035 [Isosphaeraceae bacterium]